MGPSDGGLSLPGVREGEVTGMVGESGELLPLSLEDRSIEWCQGDPWSALDTLSKLCLGFCKYEPRIRVVYEPRTATSLVYPYEARIRRLSRIRVVYEACMACSV